jgi:hypothetical protein
LCISSMVTKPCSVAHTTCASAAAPRIAFQVLPGAAPEATLPETDREMTGALTGRRRERMTHATRA